MSYQIYLSGCIWGEIHVKTVFVWLNSKFNDHQNKPEDLFISLSQGCELKHNRHEPHRCNKSITKRSFSLIPHTNTGTSHIDAYKFSTTHTDTQTAPHFCLGKKVITFSPCLNAFKSLSGAIPRWASEIHLNSFWESKQSYCCTLKLWLEREKKIWVEFEGAGEDW